MYILYIYIYIRIWRSESIITASIVVRSPTYECSYECTECDNWHGRHHPKIVLFSAIARLSVWLTDSLYLAFLLTRSDWKATEMKRSFGQPALRLSVCPSFGLYAIDDVCLESCSGGQRNTCAPLYSVCDTLIKTHCGFWRLFKYVNQRYESIGEWTIDVYGRYVRRLFFYVLIRRYFIELK